MAFVGFAAFIFLKEDSDVRATLSNSAPMLVAYVVALGFAGYPDLIEDRKVNPRLVRTYYPLIVASLVVVCIAVLAIAVFAGFSPNWVQWWMVIGTIPGCFAYHRLAKLGNRSGEKNLPPPSDQGSRTGIQA